MNKKTYRPHVFYSVRTVEGLRLQYLYLNRKNLSYKKAFRLFELMRYINNRGVVEWNGCVSDIQRCVNFYSQLKEKAVYRDLKTLASCRLIHDGRIPQELLRFFEND